MVRGVPLSRCWGGGRYETPVEFPVHRSWTVYACGAKYGVSERPFNLSAVKLATAIISLQKPDKLLFRFNGTPTI